MVFVCIKRVGKRLFSKRLYTYIVPYSELLKYSPAFLFSLFSDELYDYTEKGIIFRKYIQIGMTLSMFSLIRSFFFSNLQL